MRKILCLGDSNTYGYDPRSYLGERYPEDVRWTGLLWTAGWEVLNRGQNGLEIPPGDRRCDAYAHLIERVLPVDVVTVMLGGNDLLQHPEFTVEDVALRMESFLRYLLACIHGVRAPADCPTTDAARRMGRGGAAVDRIRAAGHLLLGTGEATRCRVCRRGKVGCGIGVRRWHFSSAGHAAFARGIIEALME